MQRRPTLLNSCAKAATAAEARFRIDVPIAPARAARVVALDEGAAAVVRRVAEHTWASARFFTCEARVPAPEVNDGSAGVRLRTVDGAPAQLVDELTGADVAVMVATADDGAVDAAVIGAACTVRGIMTAGLILGEGDVGAAVSALRPHARVLMISADEQDVAEILTALRA
ncbi:MAG: hypothetical protein ACRDO1_02665 [Nocardioidaceae bacterium]